MAAGSIGLCNPTARTWRLVIRLGQDALQPFSEIPGGAKLL